MLTFTSCETDGLVFDIFALQRDRDLVALKASRCVRLSQGLVAIDFYNLNKRASYQL